MNKQPIFILTGAPASGKTSISKALLKRFPYGVHIPVDDLRGMVVSGVSNPIGSWDDETERQFGLARDSAALIAKTYAQSGFVVVIDDVIFPDAVTHHYGSILAAYDLYKVLLRPNITVTKARNKNRKIDGDKAQLERIIQPIYAHFATFDLNEMEQDGWCIIDTSHISIEETVSEVIAQTGCFPR